MKIIKQSVQLLWITPDPEKQIEIAGRVCYKSEDRITDQSSGDFCRRMRESGHHAMIEHASASFRIVTDRGISHEIVRHRLASYAQESTRWINYGGKDMEFIEPSGFNKWSDYAKEHFTMSCFDAEVSYKALLNEGLKPQQARAVLPNCLKTEIVMTANFREWRHFIKLRTSKAAHPQIRSIAAGIWTMLNAHSPNVFEDLLPDEELFIPESLIHFKI